MASLMKALWIMASIANIACALFVVPWSKMQGGVTFLMGALAALTPFTVFGAIWFIRIKLRLLDSLQAKISSLEQADQILLNKINAIPLPTVDPRPGGAVPTSF